ncbi:hypothetical protein GC177_02460 [bacterium]|nr:hypothetical protein [bacterium]
MMAQPIPIGEAYQSVLTMQLLDLLLPANTLEGFNAILINTARNLDYTTAVFNANPDATLVLASLVIPSPRGTPHPNDPTKIVDHSVMLAYQPATNSFLYQCPYGMPVPDYLREHLQQQLPGCAIHTIQAAQQHPGQHDCAPWTIHNIQTLFNWQGQHPDGNLEDYTRTVDVQTDIAPIREQHNAILEEVNRMKGDQPRLRIGVPRT